MPTNTEKEGATLSQEYSSSEAVKIKPVVLFYAMRHF